jgi:hypothetical protein
MTVTLRGDPGRLTTEQLQSIVTMAQRGIAGEPGWDGVWVSCPHEKDDMAYFCWLDGERIVINGGILPDGSSHT